MIDQKQLLAIFPKTPAARLAEFVDPLNTCFDKYKITAGAPQAWFLGVYAHECGEFRVLEENLNYSADGLANTWPSRYAAKDHTGKYIRKLQPDGHTYRYIPNGIATNLHRRPEAIANNVYANRMGNGDEASGDGWLFRGGGVPQLTGRDNYTAYQAGTGVPVLKNPALIRTPVGAVDPAGWFWRENNLIRWVRANDFDGLCDSVNIGRKTKEIGDAIGYAERVKIRDRAMKVLA